ncbi:2',3'-cyclic-nucleotide 2'-phosphodiesterase/3'-nucleotidase [Motilibacter peucedani]|uniref:2',3'-cyclic-nucleotide 2'-phosphodiesterase/3'-nucleotidase n=1 Tax=Motilibacter peucedani TaxID=598650 RepID=A0A420XM20_9ACTN|nr:5'-nucleotidase C-terminal domain-containing protein [Motilibacter peucedani]RKS72406.1 2',3'-cyclic-nucleotide 2'-phosphodiesterase/3'-nucleotidase [Motilibacter peucedani]
MRHLSSRRLAVTSALGVAALGAALAAPAASAQQNPASITVTVMGTSDLHGHVYNWDYFKDAEYDDAAHNDVGLAKISTLVNDVRAQRGRDRTLLFDSGDTIQGTPLSYYYAKVEPITETGATHPMAAAMNVIGYDAITLGNHEYNYGLKMLGKWSRQVHAPVLAANAIDVRTGKPAYRPWVMKKVKVPGHKPVKFGVLGLTNPGIAIWDKANVQGKQRFDDLVATAKKYVPMMKAEGADVVVVTAHSGDSGLSSYGTDLPVENASALIAQQVPDVDAVLVGHAHKDIPEEFVTNPTTGKKVLLAEPALWGERLTVMDFGLRTKGSGWEVVSKHSQNLNSNTVPADPAVLAATATAHAKTVAYVNQPVATSTEELSGARSRLEDTPIVDFIQKVQTDTVTKALAGTQYASLPVLSVAAPFSREALFPAGQVRIKDVAGLYIYDNTLEAVTMNGAQVKDYLEYSAKYFKQVAPGAPIDEQDLTDNGQPDYNYDMLSGVAYDIDISKPVGSRIVGLSHPDGSPVTAADQFVVAVNNYRRSGGGGFPAVSTAPVVYNQQADIRQMLIDYATATGSIDPADFAVVNWRLVREGVPVFP